ncbi:hypothetical protein QYF36_022888 [Acer negundo]|nr:hypothetical protein QYF36_022888 [Acer negundo]
MMLFYSSGTTKNSLKKSLAQTLSYYYPYAGRVNLDGCSIDCDDSGAPFIEAHVANTMSEILQRLEFDVLAQLLPFKNDQNKLHGNKSIIVVQVNYFSCGGVAITISFKHVIADGPASANFIKAWSDNNHNHLYTSTIIKDDVVFDCASVFPQQDLPLKALWKNCFQVSVPLGEALVKRFTFDGTKMAALRAKIGDHPTRFEAVTTLILVAAADAARERETDDVKPKNVALIPINIRKRMNPPFPEKCLGNVGQATVVKWEMEERIEYNSFAKRIRESIRKMDDKYARKLNESGGFLNDLENVNEEISKMNVYFVSTMDKE